VRMALKNCEEENYDGTCTEVLVVDHFSWKINNIGTAEQRHTLACVGRAWTMDRAQAHPSAPPTRPLPIDTFENRSPRVMIGNDWWSIHDVDDDNDIFFACPIELITGRLLEQDARRELYRNERFEQFTNPAGLTQDMFFTHSSFVLRHELDRPLIQKYMWFNDREDMLNMNLDPVNPDSPVEQAQA
jgi:hypothetical protein